MTIYRAIGWLLFGVGAATWIVMLRYFLIIGAELTRARRAGEARHIPDGGGRGLPVVVIFAKDALPKVEKQRKRLVWAIVFFLLLCLSLMLFIAEVGPIR